MYFSLPWYFSLAQCWCQRISPIPCISPPKCPCETDKPTGLSAGFYGSGFFAAIQINFSGMQVHVYVAALEFEDNKKTKEKKRYMQNLVYAVDSEFE